MNLNVVKWDVCRHVFQSFRPKTFMFIEHVNVAGGEYIIVELKCFEIIHIMKVCDNVM